MHKLHPLVHSMESDTGFQKSIAPQVLRCMYSYLQYLQLGAKPSGKCTAVPQADAAISAKRITIWTYSGELEIWTTMSTNILFLI